MSNEYPEIVITCDTREQSAFIKNHKEPSAIVKGKYLLSDYTESELFYLSKKRPRIFSVYDHFTKKGADVAIGKLDRCDYKVTGYHRNKAVNIGIEYKHITDFAGSHEDLPWKLWESAGMYDEVALFLEGDIDIEEHGTFYFVRNWAAPSDTLRYDLLQARLATWSDQGVHVRHFEKPDQFAPTLENLIDYVTKETHSGVEYREECKSSLTLKMLLQIPGIKLVTASKLLKDNPDLSVAQLFAMDTKELKGKIGKVTGEKLWRILHDVDYVPEKKAKSHELV